MRALAFSFVIPLLGAIAVADAQPNVPDSSNCFSTIDGVRRVYLCPDGLGDCPMATFTITVLNAANNPINNAVVEILIGGQGTNHTGICPNQRLVANTDPRGIVAFNIGGGGCYKAADAVVIRANDVVIRVFEAVMSSDYAGTDNIGLPGRWNLAVSPTDLAAFVACYQGGAGPPSCHDYNNDGRTAPIDLSTFVSAYLGGANRCP